jgi:hypothetical protein
MRPVLFDSASGVGEGLSMSYLAELTIKKADASQHCANLVLVISYWHSDE